MALKSPSKDKPDPAVLAKLHDQMRAAEIRWQACIRRTEQTIRDQTEAATEEARAKAHYVRCHTKYLQYAR
ncbi:MAG TPA: hypothetical protein VHO25_16940 [Polyangiaceae bacterium]|nr:hypothetical protein [Polyangiaceae bacterium]